MATKTGSFIVHISVAALILNLFFLLLRLMNTNSIFGATIPHIQHTCVSLYPSELTDASNHVNGWQVVGHTYEEQVRLRDMAIAIATRSKTAEDNVPTVPCLSADGHLLVLSAAASRVRYGVSVTFVMVYPKDVKITLPKNNSANPLSSHLLSLWCIFDDGSVTPAYSYDSQYGNDRASLLDCPLSPFASNQLWRHNRTLRVYLASTTDKDRNRPILKAFVVAPKPAFIPSITSQQSLTMCTSPLQNKAEYLIQWL
jgi:hypothetical protein